MPNCSCSSRTTNVERSIGEAARGNNPDVSQFEEDAFNREHRRYPYRSHGQYLRAWYALIACAVLALFNGWEAFAAPFNVGDFFAAYISVGSALHPRPAHLHKPGPVPNGTTQILVFILLIILYHFKRQGLNPLRWYLNPTMDLSNPMRVESGRDRKGRFPRLRPGRPKRNAGLIWNWIWIWWQ